MSGEQKTYPSQFEKVKAITDQLEAGIQALFESEKFQQYLKILSKFHDYSLNNTLLIAMQKPDATLVAGYTGPGRSSLAVRFRRAKAGSAFLPRLPTKRRWKLIRRIPSPARSLKIRMEQAPRKARKF